MRNATLLPHDLWEVAAKNPEGFTRNIWTGESPAAGFVVAYEETQNSFDEAGLLRCYEHAANHGGWVGGWLDTESGKYYFDSVEIVTDRKQALQMGARNKQIAIFDLNSFETIYL